MDVWEKLVLQWINCLWDNTSNCIQDLSQLEDGKIYYRLLNKIKPWNSQDYNGTEKEVILRYLQDEYPKCKFQNKNGKIRSLCIASLILTRLSLEPTFHKSLCTDLSSDAQMKIKLVLESIYPLGQNVTEEDFCKIFSISTKPEVGSSVLKPRFLLEEFLKSPIMKTVHSDNKMHEQSRQMRKLRADIETLSYEKSELIEDIKVQEKQIKELQNKLQEALNELKSLRQNNHKLNDTNSSDPIKNLNSVESMYKKEIESLEIYVAELQNENVQLQDEKSKLITEVKIYKEKCCELKEKNESNEQNIEAMLLQIEKKEEELAELKMRHDELCYHLKEKSKTYLNNLSYEIDDKTWSFGDTSFNKSFNRSEALSSVIEVQLQDTKKELIIMQNNYKSINSLLTMLIEEYEKLRLKIELLSKQNTKSKIEDLSESRECGKLNNNLQTCIRSYHFKNIPYLYFLNQYDARRKASKLALTLLKKKHQNDLLDQIEDLNIFLKSKENKKIRYIGRFVCTFQNFIWQKYWDKQLLGLLKIILQEIIKMKITSGKSESFDLSLLNVAKYRNFNANEIYLELLNFVKNNCEILIERPKKKKCISTLVQTDIKHYSTISAQTDIKTYFTSSMQTDIKEYSSKPIQTDEKNFTSIAVQTDVKTFFSTSIQTDVKEYSSIAIQTAEKNCSSICIQTEIENNKNVQISQDALKSLQLAWVQLSESLKSDSKIHEVLLLLEKNWSFALESLKDVTDNYNSQIHPEFKELLMEKDIIENEMKDIRTKNLKVLSLNLIIAIQLVTTLTKNQNLNISSSFEECELSVTENLKSLFSNSLNQNTQDSDKLNILRDDISNKIVDIKKKIDDFHYLTEAYKNKLNCPSPNIPEEDNKENLNILKIGNPTQLSNEDISQSPQFQKYIREVHEKYETKLEKMKEKMKTAFNNQILILKKEHEMALKNKIEALQTKFEYQCLNHTEELKKYKKHISELTTQLWDVGEKLIIEKQKKEDFMKKCREMQSKYEDIENHFENAAAKPRVDINASISDTTFNKMHSVRGFQLMGNAFSNEDEEGEVFDTTYNLADMQRPRPSLSSVDLNRLSILQMRNSKCKPHLKSSYPTEVRDLPPTLTEDDIKSGNPEEFLNDSLSQSLLTGKKVKRKDRTRNNSETPRRSRRFSNIFRKPRLSIDHK